MLNLSRGINWIPFLFLSIYQVLLLVSLPFYLYYTPPSWGIVLVTFVLFYLTGLSITAGYHRYFSHKSFQTDRFVEAILLFFGTLTVQGSALRWSFDHRLHHARVDTDDDPYSIKKGFMYAHCLWIIEKPRKIESPIVSDLLKKPMVVFQHKYYPLLMLTANFLVGIFFGWVLQDYLGALLMVVGVRLFLLHHFTWFINSLAHTWGSKTYSQEHSALDNYCVSLLTFGEGYHNYHHTYANDYRNGIRWYHYDPTKWLIWALSKFRIVHHLRKMDPVSVRKRLVREDELQMIQRLKNVLSVKREELETYIKNLSEQLNANFAKQKQLMERYRSSKKDCSSLPLIKKELKEVKQTIRRDWKKWKRLNADILNMRPEQTNALTT